VLHARRDQRASAHFHLRRAIGRFTRAPLRARFRPSSAALGCEELRCVDQARARSWPRQTCLDRSDLRCSAVAGAPRQSATSESIATIRRSSAQARGERLGFGAHLSEPSAIVRHLGAGLDNRGFEIGGGRETLSRLRRGRARASASAMAAVSRACASASAERREVIRFEFAFGGGVPMQPHQLRVAGRASAPSGILGIAGRRDFRLGGVADSRRM